MKHILIKLVALLMIQLCVQDVKAQLNPMGALYFQNQYLGNPAMAGMQGFDLNLGLRKQWSNLPGSPATQTFTADYAFSKNAGIGVNIYNENAGLFKSTRTVATYAYHLPLNASDSRLSFGLSLGLMNERISNEDVNGDANDPDIANFNQRETYMDGDFGMAYTSDRLNIQGAIPNMKGILKKDLINTTVDRSTFFTAISYKIKASGSEGIGIEPKVAYRGIKGMDNILDVGANLTYASRLALFGMYHSSKSASFGLGMNYQSFSITGIYTTNTSALAAYTNGNFEVGLKARLFK